MLYVPTSKHTTTSTAVTAPPRQVYARDIKRLRTKGERAQAAADLVSGRAILAYDPKTAASVCGVSRPYVAAVLRIRTCRPDLAPRLRHEPVYRVAAAAGFGWAPHHQLVTSWNLASDAQRVEFVRQVTPDVMWSVVTQAIG